MMRSRSLPASAQRAQPGHGRARRPPSTGGEGRCQPVPGDRRQPGVQCRWQAPGPSGCPQLPQGAGRSLRLLGEALAALKADSFLRRSVLSHCGQCSAGEDWRTSFSNSCPQAAHSYSKMGMASILPMVPKTLAVRDVAGGRGRSHMLPVFTLTADHTGLAGWCAQREALPRGRRWCRKRRSQPAPATARPHADPQRNWCRLIALARHRIRDASVASGAGR